MIVKTSRFGDKEVPEESVIAFPEGVIGFRDATRFVMFECSEDGLFKWLQSCDRPELAFVTAEATLIAPNYRIMIGEKERALLELSDVGDVAVCLILIIPDNFMDATANLLGPLIMNAQSRIGMQVVVVNPEYSARHRLFAPQDGPSAGGKEADRAGA
jgi:flagellar assembly factor FliW